MTDTNFNELMNKMDMLLKKTDENRKKMEQMYKVLFYQSAVAVQHQKVFSKYKGIHAGQDVVLVASGPTFDYFDPKSINNAIYVGVNRVCENINIKLNYLFVMDYQGIKKNNEPFINYNSNCKKFVGIMLPNHVHLEQYRQWQLPIDFITRANAEFFYLTDSGIFPHDISLLPLTSGGSIAFPTMYFLLYTQPKRIFIVGCDCGGGHFNDKNEKLLDKLALSFVSYWKNVKKDAQTWYPSTEIISINPVGLKGMFKDVYTKSYLAEHPEIDAKNVELLEDLIKEETE